MGDLGDVGNEKYSSYPSVNVNESKEDSQIKGIVSGIVLLVSVGLITNTDPARVLQDANKVLKLFLRDNYIRK